MRLIFYFVGISIVLYLLYLLSSTTDKKIEALRQENQKIELRVDSLELQNDSIRIQLESYAIRIDSMKKVDLNLSEQYKDNKKAIQKIKDKYEKNNRIDSFTTRDIIKYFTDSL